MLPDNCNNGIKAALAPFQAERWSHRPTAPKKNSGQTGRRPVSPEKRLSAAGPTHVSLCSHKLSTLARSGALNPPPSDTGAS